MTATRRLTAILAADVAGYSRLMGADEEGTYPHPFAAGTIGETVSPVGTTLLGGKGAACAEIVDRATKPAQVAMMMTRINVRSSDRVAPPG
jgi:hypothetical protein